MLKNLVKKFRSQTINDNEESKEEEGCDEGDGIEVTFNLKPLQLGAEDSDEDSSTPAQANSSESAVADETKSLAVSQTSDYCASDQSLFGCSIVQSDLDSNSRDSLGYESGLHGSSGDGSVFVSHVNVESPFICSTPGGNAPFGPCLPTIPQCSVPSAFRPVSSSVSGGRRRALIRPRGSFDLGGRPQQFSPMGQRDLASRHCSVDGGYIPSPALTEEGELFRRDGSTPVSHSALPPQCMISTGPGGYLCYAQCPSAPPQIRSRCFSAAEKRKRTSPSGPDPESPAPPDKFAFFNKVSALSLDGNADRAGSCEILGREKSDSGSGIFKGEGGTLSASSSLAFPVSWSSAGAGEQGTPKHGGNKDLGEQTGLEDDLEVQEVLRSESGGDSERGTPLMMLHRPSPVVPVLVAPAATYLTASTGATLPRVSPRKRPTEDRDREHQGSLLSLSERRSSDGTGSALLSTSAHCDLLPTDRPRLNFDKMREKMSKSRRTRGFTSARAKIRGLSNRGSSG